jgi:hypothetical protein
MAHRLLCRFRMRVVTVLVGIAAAGCSSSGSIPGGESGSATPGGSFAIADQISAAVTFSAGGGDLASTAWIVLASTSNLCGDDSASPPIKRKGQRFITINLYDVNNETGTTPTAPGTYMISDALGMTGYQPPKQAELVTGGFDTTCTVIDADAGTAESGTVTLSAISDNAFSGSYDIVLTTGEEMKGSFSPSACPQLATAVAPSTSAPPTPICE